MHTMNPLSRRRGDVGIEFRAHCRRPYVRIRCPVDGHSTLRAQLFGWLWGHSFYRRLGGVRIARTPALARRSECLRPSRKMNKPFLTGASGATEGISFQGKQCIDGLLLGPREEFRIPVEPKRFGEWCATVS